METDYEQMAVRLAKYPDKKAIFLALKLAHLRGGIAAVKEHYAIRCQSCGHVLDAPASRDGLCAGCADRQDDALRDDLIERAEARP